MMRLGDHGGEAHEETDRIAKLETSLREGGKTLPIPLAPVTDQLMFRKMKTNPDPLDTARPRQPMRPSPQYSRPMSYEKSF